MRFTLALVLAACGSTPQPPPPVDVAPASEAPVAAAPEVPKGPQATVRLLAVGDPALGLGLGARPGDIWLENPQVVALVAGLDHRLGPSSSGGAVLHVGRNGVAPRARLGAMLPVFDEVGQRAPLFEKLEILQDGRLGGPAIIRLLGHDPLDDGLAVSQELVLDPAGQAVRLVVEVENRSTGHYRDFRIGQLVEWGGLSPFVPGRVDARAPRSTSDWVGASGPDTSLVVAPPLGRLIGVHGPGWSILGPRPVHLTPKGRERAELWLQPGQGGEADAIRQLFAVRRTVVGEVSGRANVPGAVIELIDGLGEPVMRGVADAQGAFRLPAPPGRLTVRARAPGRHPVVAGPFNLTADQSASVPVELPGPSALQFVVEESHGGEVRPLPAHLTFEVVVDPREPPRAPPELFAEAGALKAGEAIVSATGKGRVALPPGRYRVIIDAGPAHAQAERTIDVPREGQVELAVRLARELDTSGWFALEPDVEPPAGTDGVVLRAVSCAAAGIDGVVLLGDGQIPADLGRPRLFGGLATADPGVGHFAGLPLREAVKPLPVRERAAQRLAGLAALPGAPLVAVLRPRGPGWAWFDAVAFTPTGDLPNDFSLDFNLLEVAVPAGRPVVESALADYLGLLQRGRKVVPLGGSGIRDRGDRCGVARTWVAGKPTSADELHALLSVGAVVAGFGPILDLSVEAGGKAVVRIRASAAHRPDVVRVYADGKLVKLEPLAGTGPMDQRFEARVPVGACSVVASTDRKAAQADLAGFAVTGPVPGGGNCP